MIEIKVGKATFPVVGTAKVEGNDDFLIVFLNEGKFWGQSTKTGLLAPLKFKDNKVMWGNRVAYFI
jgi:hypothetical protein